MKTWQKVLIGAGAVAGVIGIGVAVASGSPAPPGRGPLPPIVPPEGKMEATVKNRRGLRPRWQGAGAPPAELQPRPKFGIGARVKALATGSDGVPSGFDPNALHVVASYVALETVEYGPGSSLERPASATPVPGAPIVWSYTMRDGAEIGEVWLVPA